jgi:transaldolase
MGASFRNIGEITELAGCDLLTIAPSLLSELQQSTEGSLPRKLDPQAASGKTIEKINVNKALFDKMHVENRMAKDKLAEGIDGFAKALEALEKLLADRLAVLEG